MPFTRSTVWLSCICASVLTLTACSDASQAEKKSDQFTASTPATGEASNLLERNAKQRLIDTLSAHFKLANINAKIIDIKTTEVPNLYWVTLEGMGSVYSTADGKYIIQGDVVRLGDKQLHNVGETLQAEINKKRFAALNAKDLIIYPATTGKAKHIIYVFTDVSCPYCHKFHEQIPAINQKGIEVRYIAWPRGEDLIAGMEAVWCSADRKVAFNQAVKGEVLAPATCSNPVRSQYELGLNIGVNGTPAIYNQEGLYLGGYLSAEELAKRLDN